MYGNCALAMEDTDNRAREALALFCYQTKNGSAAIPRPWRSSTLVFSGGIGENAGYPRTYHKRTRLSRRTLAPQANADNAAVISTATSAVA